MYQFKKSPISVNYRLDGVAAPHFALNQRYVSNRSYGSALEAYSRNPHIRSIVGKIGDRFAKIPWFGRIGDTIVENHPALDAWCAMSGKIGHHQFKKSLISYIDTAGEVFLLKSRDNSDVVRQLFLIPPTWVRTVPDFNNSEFLVVPGHSASFTVKVENMIWIKDLDLTQPYGRGRGIGIALTDEVHADEYAARHIARTFQNNARPDLIISADNTSRRDDQDAFTSDEAKAIKSQLKANHQGPNKAGEPMVTNAAIKVEEVGQTFKDLGISEIRESLRGIFITTYGIPPEIIGLLDSSNRATITSAEFLIAKNILQPRADMIKDIINTELAKEFDDGFEFDYENPVQNDKEFELEAMKAAPYTVTRDEWRNLQGLEEKDGPDQIFVPPALNIVDLPEPDDVATGGKSFNVNKMLSDDEVEDILSLIDDDALVQAISAAVLEAFNDFGQESIDLLGVEIDFNVSDDFVQDTLLGDKTASRVVGIRETTKNRLRATLAAGQQLGEGIAQLAARVSAAFEASPSRARTIATTEVGRAQNIGILEGLRQGGADGKQWSAVLDDQTRDDHIELDNTSVPIDDNFVTRSGISTPGPQQSDIAAFDINCRCVTIPVIFDGDRSLRDTVTKNLDDMRTELEKPLIRLIVDIFDEQRNKILTALNEA